MTDTRINVMQCRSTYTTGGGPDKTALLVAERADRDRFNVVLMYMRGSRDNQFQIAKWARQKGLPVNEVVEHGKLDLDNLLQINRLIRQHNIDVFHARDYKTCFIGFLLRPFNPRTKFVFTAHGWISEGLKSRLYIWLNLLSLRKYHRIIAVSNATRQIMVDGGIDERKIEVVYNAIDVEAWSRGKVTSSLRGELHLPEGARLVGVVGRLSKEKAIATTLAVAKRITSSLANTYFVVIGDGPAREEVEKEVASLELSDRVFLTGFRHDALNVYAALDLLLSTSLTEGIPNTVLEAMAMEVPVVHTAVGGVPEMIEDGISGVLCEVGDVEGITKAVMEVLTDENKARRLREEGRRTVCSRFSFETRMKAVESIYEHVVR